MAVNDLNEYVHGKVLKSAVAEIYVSRAYRLISWAFFVNLGIMSRVNFQGAR